ncbi:hypothetical protein PQX77_011060 [Marasmius sp. AFHP31]|nr:hypothetical protein PQX77_011060 [Marasmius sp. AFHP31]
MDMSPPPLGNLPGLRWDAEKKRYFPVSVSTAQVSVPSASTLSNPQISHKRKRTVTRTATSNKRNSSSSATSEELHDGSTSHAHTSSSKNNSELANRPRVKWKGWNDAVRFGSGYSERERAMSAVIAAKTIKPRSMWTRTSAPPVIGNIITAMKLSTTDNNRRIFIGDSLGWLFTYLRVSHFQDTGELSSDEESARIATTWNGEYQVNLHPGGEVSSIHTSRNRCIATCFGPTTRICVERFDSDEFPETTLLTLPSHIHDVRSSCLLPVDNAELDGESLPRGMVLGAAKKAVHIPDLEYSSQRDMRMLTTDSDVFCVTPGTQNIVYAGCRNGGIKRFDLRSPSTYIHIEPGVGKGRGQSSVMYMCPLKYYPNEIIVGWMNGEVWLFCWSRREVNQAHGYSYTRTTLDLLVPVARLHRHERSEDM